MINSDDFKSLREAEEEYKKPNQERIADALDKIVQLMDYQNKMLTDIASTLRKKK